MLPITFESCCRHIDGILMCYEKIYKSINVDQPKADVFSQGELSVVYDSLSDLNNSSFPSDLSLHGVS